MAYCLVENVKKATTGWEVFRSKMRATALVCFQKADKSYSAIKGTATYLIQMLVLETSLIAGNITK